MAVVPTDHERRERVLDRLRPLLSREQVAAAMAMLVLDPDAIEALTDDQLRAVLAGLAEQAQLDPAERDRAREAGQRYRDEIS